MPQHRNTIMAKALGVVLLLVLAGCSSLPGQPMPESACAASEASYACQVERYRNVDI
jgi:hypothetical protein